MAQTLPVGGDSIQKWRGLNVSLGTKLEKNFQTVHMCILFGIFARFRFIEI